MKKTDTALRGFWGLFWRSAVFLPLAMVLTSLWLAVWTAVYVLPVLAVYFLVLREWWHGALTLGVWFLFLLLSRWKRLHVDKKDILNENENL